MKDPTRSIASECVSVFCYIVVAYLTTLSVTHVAQRCVAVIKDVERGGRGLT